MPHLDGETVVYPSIEDRSIPSDARCQETRGMIGNKYIRCGKPAVAIIKTRDTNPYYMCQSCAWHNVQNRGAVVIFSTKEIL